MTDRSRRPRGVDLRPSGLAVSKFVCFTARSRYCELASVITPLRGRLERAGHLGGDEPMAVTDDVDEDETRELLTDKLE